MSTKLYNTGTTKAYDQKDLNILFNTKGGEYLESNKVPVINRKFNWIPTGGKGDPPRALTDAPPNKTLYANNNVGVVNDLPKSNTAHDIGRLWVDGTYADMVRQSDEDNEDFYKYVKFAKDTDFDMRFARLEREQELPVGIATYFNEREAERDMERRIYLEEYGLTPDEVSRAISEKKVKDALTSLEGGKRLLGRNAKQLESAIAKATGKIRDEATPIADMSRLPVKAPVETTVRSAVKGRAGAVARWGGGALPGVEGVFGGGGGMPMRGGTFNPFNPIMPDDSETESSPSELSAPSQRRAGRPVDEGKEARLKQRFNELAQLYKRGEIEDDALESTVSDMTKEDQRLLKNLYVARTGGKKSKRGTRSNVKGDLADFIRAGKKLK